MGGVSGACEGARVQCHREGNIQGPQDDYMKPRLTVWAPRELRVRDEAEGLQSRGSHARNAPGKLGLKNTRPVDTS